MNARATRPTWTATAPDDVLCIVRDYACTSILVPESSIATRRHEAIDELQRRARTRTLARKRGKR